MSGGAFRDRLRRLRRDPLPGAAASVEPSPPVEARALSEASEGEPRAMEHNAGSGTWFRSASYAVDSVHGDFGLREVRDASTAEFALLTGDAALGALDLERAVYLDTETSGLSGGAGTYVFMIGLGSFVRARDGSARFEVWQGFLRDPGGEAALLEECARRISGHESVVSFFGKSFDRHRLEDKMRLCGVAPPFEGRPHLDLYHPCRRLYRGAYEDGRLKTLEHELCGLARCDDLPGSQAPEAWFDYLAGRAHRLDGVFRHNLDDVLSLVTLAAHLGRSSEERRGDSRPLSGDPATRAAGLARSHLLAGDRRRALQWLERALERRHPDRRELAFLRAELLYKLKEVEAARAALAEFVAAPEDRFSARGLALLAKLLEHRLADHAAALEAARVAMHLAPRTLVGRELARLRTDLEGRIARLERRCAQAESRSR